MIQLTAAEYSKLKTIEAAAINLFDNRLGWGDGRNPYSMPEIWLELGKALYGPDTTLNHPDDEDTETEQRVSGVEDRRNGSDRRSLGFQHAVQSNLRSGVDRRQVNRRLGITATEFQAPPEKDTNTATDRMFVTREFAHVINANSLENGSNTPDFVLASFLQECIGVFDRAVVARTKWYSAGLPEEAVMLDDARDILAETDILVADHEPEILRLIRLGASYMKSPTDWVGKTKVDSEPKVDLGTPTFVTSTLTIDGGEFDGTR